MRQPKRSSACRVCFNSRTHAGCDSHSESRQPTFRVSIHAPMQGATKLFLLVSRFTDRFNSRTQQGATGAHDCGVPYCAGFNSRTHAGCNTSRLKMVSSRTCFNSRTHAGCDWLSMSSIDPIHRFNSRTHAGCDRRALNRSRLYQRFNSRTHAGCDLPLAVIPLDRRVFQFTHPCRVRPSVQVPRGSYGSFNSRTHAGCDYTNRLPDWLETVSIHAPMQGATDDVHRVHRGRVVSIHAPV